MGFDCDAIVTGAVPVAAAFGMQHVGLARPLVYRGEAF
jgi:hypothetical protein